MFMILLNFPLIAKLLHTVYNDSEFLMSHFVAQFAFNGIVHI